MKLIIKKETVVKLFVALGFKTAEKWDDKRLLSKITQLPDFVDLKNIKNAKMRKILKKIMHADKVAFKGMKEEQPERPSEAAMRETEGGKVSKKKASEDKGKGKGKKTTKTKTAKKQAPTKKPKAKEKDDKDAAVKKEVEKDAFGRRAGSQGALIDTKLGKKAKSIEEIAKESKLPVGRISNHMRDLLSKGFVIKNNDGKYRIK